MCERVEEGEKRGGVGVISSYFPPDGTHNRQLAGDVVGEGLYIGLQQIVLSRLVPKELKNQTPTLASG